MRRAHACSASRWFLRDSTVPTNSAYGRGHGDSRGVELLRRHPARQACHAAGWRGPAPLGAVPLEVVPARAGDRRNAGCRLGDEVQVAVEQLVHRGRVAGLEHGREVVQQVDAARARGVRIAGGEHEGVVDPHGAEEHEDACRSMTTGAAVRARARQADAAAASAARSAAAPADAPVRTSASVSRCGELDEHAPSAVEHDDAAASGRPPASSGAVSAMTRCTPETDSCRCRNSTRSVTSSRVRHACSVGATAA